MMQTQQALWAPTSRYIRPSCRVERHSECDHTYHRSPVWIEECTCDCHEENR